MSKRKIPVLWAALTGVSVGLVAVFSVAWGITGNYTKVINQAFGLKNTATIQTEAQKAQGTKFPKAFEEIEDAKQNDMKIAEQLTEEGIVLLKNKADSTGKKALPLANEKTTKVTILGHQSTNMLVCGTGSADISAILDKGKYGSSFGDIDGYLNLKAALEERTNVDVNETVWNTYMNWTENETYLTNPKKGDNSIRSSKGSLSSYSINEVPYATLTEQPGVKDSIEKYKDGTAIVVISRLGGEMYDLPSSGKTIKEGGTGKGNTEETVNGSGNSLELTTNELDLIHNAHETFNKVVVLVNSANAIECDFLTQENSEVDAAMWIGYVGLVGLYGVADTLVGNSTPSGRLVDTYCNDNTTNPAMVNFYGQIWKNATDLGAYWDEDSGTYKGTNNTSYMTGTFGGDLDGNMVYNNYAEGIYVGYRYYETRYADTIMGQGNTAGYNYLSDVAYPFGYGLSYTTFEYGTPKFTESSDGKSIDVEVEVKNTGDYDGKDVVEVYFQSEYTAEDIKNGIEKTAIELCGFTKTPVIKKGESYTANITVDKETFKTYSTQANGGNGQYIMDAGNYYLAVGTDAHDALNNILTVQNKTGMVTAGDKVSSTGSASNVYKWEQKETDEKTYLKSSATGNEIHNQFQSGQLSYYGGDDLDQLSRSDWEKTWPKDKFTTQITLTQGMMNEMTGIKEYKYEDYQVAGETMPTFGKAGSMKLSDMFGKAYDDPSWDTLLDQVTIAEACELVGVGYHGTVALESISKPDTTDENGPQGFSGNLTSLSGESESLCAYTDENIMAATWNVEFMEEVGQCIGEDGLWGGYSGLYGPAMNTHKTAYSGRNFEYYSEDGFLAGKIAAAEVKGIQSKGVYVFVKHFALNDCETGCRAVSTFVNEQAIREVYLQPFEYAITEGGAHNVMNAFSRVGVIWSGAHEGLMTEVLRGEWGCDGFGISDYTNTGYKTKANNSHGTYDAFLGVIAGTDTFDSSDKASQCATLLTLDYENDVHLMNRLRESVHRICYIVGNSSAMNTSGTVYKIMNWWQFVLIDGIIWSGVATVAFATVFTIKFIKGKKNDDVSGK